MLTTALQNSQEFIAYNEADFKASHSDAEKGLK